jgi:hypothetical protein
MPITCQLCNQTFEKQINNKHLKYKHGISTAEYKDQFGSDSLSSPEYRAEKSSAARGANNPMFGKTQSDAAKSSISEKNQGKTPHNKGKKVTDPDVLLRIRAAMERREEQYRINGNHPRLNARLSEESRSKISTGIKEYAKDHKDEMVIRARKSLETKIKNGYDLGSAMRGKKHSESTRSIISIKSRQYGEARRLETLKRHQERLAEINIKIIGTDGNVAKMHCEICDTTFTRTIQYFHPSKFTEKLCRICNPPPTKSKDEIELLNYVRSITDKEVISGNRNTITPLELDIYIPDLKIAIEYCGLYWHSELSGKDPKYHLNKHEACKYKDIRLITIFEDEWIENPDIVKSRLINLISNPKNRIFARKCEVKVIENSTARQFCKDNHLQGAGLTRIAYGLYYETELMSVMTFARPNISKGYKKDEQGHWELTRFCTRLDTRIIGGASKLFKAFIRDNDPSYIMSYADLRWNTGKVYEAIGFDYHGRSTPNYWYFQLPDLKRIHRFALRKNDRDNQSKTEWENRIEQGWNRIWDCGNDKWIWSKG